MLQKFLLCFQRQLHLFLHPRSTEVGKHLNTPDWNPTVCAGLLLITLPLQFLVPIPPHHQLLLHVLTTQAHTLRCLWKRKRLAHSLQRFCNLEGWQITFLSSLKVFSLQNDQSNFYQNALYSNGLIKSLYWKQYCFKISIKRNENGSFFLFYIARCHSAEVDPDKAYIRYLH